MISIRRFSKLKSSGDKNITKRRPPNPIIKNSYDILKLKTSSFIRFRIKIVNSGISSPTVLSPTNYLQKVFVNNNLTILSSVVY